MTRTRRDGAPAKPRTIGAVVVVAALLGAAVGWTLRADRLRAEAADTALAALKAQFRRPAAVPFPADNPYRAAKAVLGRRLFFDPRLSGDGTLACGCHDPAKNWSDGRSTGRGARGQALKRRTPALWNLAWAETLFWDGRADSLEHQATMPIDNPDEMNRRLDDLVAWLRGDADYPAAFAAAFPDAGEITADRLAQALATYQRTLVSPPAPFDRWIEGDEAAISDAAKRGFRLFAGKANCAACHKGWAFTDHAFHDIGMPGDDRGRGAVLGLAAADHAFKTPGLRDVAVRGPYMHDGAVKSLAEVITHYETFRFRPTLSRDMKRIALAAGDRRDLVAFLETLTSPGPVDAAPRIVATIAAPPLGPAAATRIVAQRDTQFLPQRIRIARGTMIYVRNDDDRTHNVRVHDPRFTHDSGAQEPGETVRLSFPADGRFTVFCGIHPKMKLIVEVEP